MEAVAKLPVPSEGYQDCIAAAEGWMADDHNNDVVLCLLEAAELLAGDRHSTLIHLLRQRVHMDMMLQAHFG